MEPVHTHTMGISTVPIEVYTRHTIQSGGDDLTYITRKYTIDGPIVKVSESSTTLYDRYGQEVEVGKSNSTKEILV